jgi:hypothetical protein
MNTRAITRIAKPLAFCCAALLVAASACTAKTGPGADGAGGTTSPKPKTSAHKSAASGSAGSTQGGGARATTPGGGGGTGGGGAIFDDHGSVGAMSLAYLRSSPARSLVVEIDYVTGFKPAQTATDHLRAVLSRELGKPGGVSVLVDDEIPIQRTAYTFDQIDGLESRYRSHRSSGDTATMWLIYLNGDLAGDNGTLGVAFRASEAALFKEQIRGAASPLVDADSIERSVIVHESGHLLGLVNIGYHSKFDHEDPDHPHHSNKRTSVMFWAIEDISIATILRGGPPDDFDNYDKGDLQQLRG